MYEEYNLFQVLQGLVNPLRADIRARFQSFDMSALRNCRLYSGLILFEDGRALLQRLLGRPCVQALVSERVA